MNRLLPTLCFAVCALLVACPGPAGFDAGGERPTLSGDEIPTPAPGGGGPGSDDDDSSGDPDGPVREICDNGLDDDQDGLADCVDPECAATPACSPDEELATAFTLELSFLSEYLDDGENVWRNDAVVGVSHFERSRWTGSQWLVECASRFELTGEAAVPPDCLDCQLQLALSVAEVVAQDCGDLYAVDVPVGVGLTEGSSVGAMESTFGGWQDWELASGEIDWSNWLAGDAWSVQSTAPLVFVAP